MQPLIINTDRGFYCPAGDFYIDPWQPVERAIVTHAHADHARPGSRAYLVAQAGERVFRTRLGQQALIETLEYGEVVSINCVQISFHPAG
nr:DNA ligase-associated DEXH box helicase [Chloroflexaceae bacterium]